jgi:hypothetical protein
VLRCVHWQEKSRGRRRRSGRGHDVTFSDGRDRVLRETSHPFEHLWDENRFDHTLHNLRWSRILNQLPTRSSSSSD